MHDKLVQKVCVGLLVVMFAVALARRRRAGKPTREELTDLVGAGAGILTVIPLGFDLSVFWSLPFFVTAFALLAVAFRRLPSSGGPPPADK